MAPEQVAGDDPSPAWDIWALSVITYEILTGKHPFREAVVPGTGESSDNAGTTAHPIRRTALPGSLDAFFGRALSRNRAERPQNAAVFLSALEQVLA